MCSDVLLVQTAKRACNLCERVLSSAPPSFEWVNWSPPCAHLANSGLRHRGPFRAVKNSRRLALRSTQLAAEVLYTRAASFVHEVFHAEASNLRGEFSVNGSDDDGPAAVPRVAF